MAFNHYAKLKRIILELEAGWTIRVINEKTSVRNFKGDMVSFPHYYRIYAVTGEPVKYGKFQQLDRLASVLDIPEEALPVQQY